MTFFTQIKSIPALSLALASDVIIAVFLIDQVKKWWMLEQIIRPSITGEWSGGRGFIDWITQTTLPRYPFTQIEVYPWFNAVMVWNEGISFGLFNNGTTGSGNMALMIGLGVIVAGFTIWMVRTPILPLKFLLAVIIGGALGNLWDRVRFGAVADFYDFHIGSYHYPAFNIADSAIVMGMIGLLIYEIFYRGKEKTS